jgi:hypothetical protein
MCAASAASGSLVSYQEPQPPVVDRKVLELVQSNTFHPAVFTIRSDGVRRLNPEMAKNAVNCVYRRLTYSSNNPAFNLVESR